MQIIHVRLENFHKHICLDVDFAPGVNALIGPNGAGKSAVLMAVRWALFDYAPVKQASMVRRGAKSAFVHVDFTHAGETWRVCRDTNGRFDVSKGTDFEQVSSGKTESMAVLRQALGLAGDADVSKLCRDALAPDQGALVEPFRLSTTKRIEAWAPVLRLNEYREAFAELKEPSRQLEIREKSLEEAVSALRSTLHTLTPDAISTEMLENAPQDCYAASLSNLEDAKAELADAETKHTQANTDLAELQRQQQRHAHLREIVESHQRTLAQVKAQLERIACQRKEDMPRLAALQAEQETIQVDNQAERDYQTCFTEHGGRVANYDLVVESIAKKERELKGLQEAHEQAKKAAMRLAVTVEPRIKALEAKYDALRGRWSDLKAALDRDSAGLEALIPGSECPTCGAPMTEEAIEARREVLMKAIGESENAKALVELDAGKVELEIKELKKEKLKLDLDVSRDPGAEFIEMNARVLEKDRQDKERLTRQIAELNEQLAFLNRRREKATLDNERYMELVKEIASIEARQRQNDAWEPAQERERAVLQADIQSAQEGLEAIPVSLDDDIAAMAHRVEELQYTVTTTRLDVSELQTQTDNLKRAIGIVEAMETREAEREQAVYARRLLERCRKAISDAGPHVAGQVMGRLSAVAQQYWVQMGKSMQLEWTGDFQVLVDGLSLEEHLSGGEQVAAALACRMAVAHFQADLGWIVLDEPTIHLDASARFGLAESLERLNLTQVIVVSHDDSFQAVAANVINIA